MDEQSSQTSREYRTQRWPRNQQRERVLRLVRGHDGPIDASELAALMGLHVTTARFHLDALCEEGAIARTRIKRSGVGRPRTGYVPVRDRLDYRSLAEVLALELGDTVAERERRAERAGHRWANRIMANQSVDAGEAPDGLADDRLDQTIDDRTAQIAQIFDRMGFDAELVPADDSADGPAERTIRLYGCPVRDLAESYPEVSCAMHLGLLQGLLGGDPNGEGGAQLRAELNSFVEPRLCIAKVIADG